MTLAYTDRGNAPVALVFLHYWGGSRRTWLEVTEQLGTRDHRLVTYDHHGWGDSSASGDYSIPALADDAAALVAKLGLDRFFLVGHSMGGKVAQLLASRRPRGLAGLVLVAPSPAAGVRLPDEQRAAMLHAYDDAAAVEATLDAVLTARPLAPHLRRRVVEDSLRGDAAAKAAWPTSAIAEDVSADLGAIVAPTLVLGGEHDRVDPVPMLEREVVARIPGSRLEVIAGSGHLSPLEAPEAIAQAVARFTRAVAA